MSRDMSTVSHFGAVSGPHTAPNWDIYRGKGARR